MRRKAPFAASALWSSGIVIPFCRSSRETRAWMGYYHKNSLALIPGEGTRGRGTGAPALLRRPVRQCMSPTVLTATFVRRITGSARRDLDREGQWHF